MTASKDKNKSSRFITVYGDLMIDRYLWGKTERISPEAPVPVVVIERESQDLGGAGNVAGNLVSLGDNVIMAGVLGDDDSSMLVRELLSKKGISDSGIVTENGRKTTVKTRVLSSHQQVLRYDMETTADIPASIELKLMRKLDAVLKKSSVVIISDYGKGITSREICRYLISYATGRGIPVLCDPKGRDYSKYSGATLITPNKKEASEATGLKINDRESLLAAGQKLLNMCGLHACLITLGEDGMALFDEEGFLHIPTKAREVFDVTGAGDTVIAGIAHALSTGKSMKEACSFANVAAGIVVGKLGSAVTTLDEIDSYTRPHAEHKIWKLGELKKALLNDRRHGKKIVFTNGCFDILHRGHLHVLEEASKLGDKLIVAVNSDSSVRKLKGPGRPINSEKDRMLAVASLSFVDYVVKFTEETPLKTIRELRPEVLVKGGDYSIETIVGSDLVLKNGGKVEVVPTLGGYSTTAFIKLIEGGGK